MGANLLILFVTLPNMKKILFSLVFICGLFVVFIYQITQAPKNTNFPKQIEYNENEPLTLFIQKLKN